MTTDIMNTAIAACQYRVLVAGGCYGGLSAAIRLLEKCDTLDLPISVDIVIVDERDGYCMSTKHLACISPSDILMRITRPHNWLAVGHGL